MSNDLQDQFQVAVDKLEKEVAAYLQLLQNEQDLLRTWTGNGPAFCYRAAHAVNHAMTQLVLPMSRVHMAEHRVLDLAMRAQEQEHAMHEHEAQTENKENDK